MYINVGRGSFMLTDDFTYFAKLYELKNITQAAEELYISRQALSSSLKKLEQKIGATLFIRSKQGINPTKAGDMVWQYMEHTQKLWSDTLASLRSDTGIITLGTNLNYMTEPVLNGIYQYQTKIKIDHYLDSRKVWSDLLDKTLDIAVSLNPPVLGALERIFIKKTQFYVLMSKNNPLSKQKEVGFAQCLKGQDLLFLSRNLMEELKAVSGANFNTQLVDNFVYARNMLLQGSLLFVPAHSVDSMISDTIVARRLIGTPIEANVYIGYYTDSSALIREFASFLKGLLLMQL